MARLNWGSFMHGSWIAISAARARAHRLYGVRGWLVTLLWLNTLPVLAVILALVATLSSGGLLGTLPLGLLWLLVPLGLVVAAFMRLRWFPVLWFVYCVLQLPMALATGFWMRRWNVYASGPTPADAGMVLLLALEVLTPVVSMAYIVRSRRVRATYRHEVRANDPAAVPAVFDRPNPNETPTDATDHARERAALRRVTQELSSGVLDTRTWVHVMRHHADDTDSARTAAYVRARMSVLCPPAHVHPPVVRTVAVALGALLVSLITAGLLVAVVFGLALRAPGGEATAMLNVLAAGPLTLSWLAGLFVGARFLRSVA